MATLEMDRQKASTGAGGAPMLEMTRVIRASRDRVFEAWTRPEVLKEWFGPGAMVVTKATLDAREGGEYVIECVGEAPGEEGRIKTSTVRGQYRRVVPNELLQFTWCGNWDSSEVSLVTISLRDVEGGTEVKLKHEQFATELSRDGHLKGWGSSLPKLVKLIEG